MDETLKTSIWQQFGAAIDMLDDAITLCPDDLWTTAVWQDPESGTDAQYWSVVHHSLVWLDLYLHGSFEGFAPPAPFVFEGQPEKPYTKAELRGYLRQCRQKCETLILGLSEEKAYTIHKFRWMAPTFLELQLYSMRHVQEHAAQLNLVLGQHGVTGQDWVSKARDEIV